MRFQFPLTRQRYSANPSSIVCAIGRQPQPMDFLPGANPHCRRILTGALFVQIQTAALGALLGGERQARAVIIEHVIRVAREDIIHGVSLTTRRLQRRERQDDRDSQQNLRNDILP